MSRALDHVTRCAAGLDLPDSTLGPLAEFCELLARHGRRANLIGMTDIQRIADEIVVDSTRIRPLIRATSGEMIDIGAGAGIPVIPLLLVLPDWTGVAVEPRQKRREFMIAARRKLGLIGRLDVVEARLSDDGRLIGEIDPNRRFDLALTKAVFPPAEWAARARRLIRCDGQIGIFASREAGVPANAQTVEYTTESGSARRVGVL